MRDELIVDLYLNKDETAILKTQQKYGLNLRKISYNILFNEEDSKEIENDTYLSAWNSIPPNNPKSYLFSFLCKITRNLSINLYNRYNTKKRNAHIIELTAEMQECIPSPTDNYCLLEESDLSNHLNSFLSSLKDYERNIFLLRYWYAYSIKEIAQKYNFSESKIKSNLFRTRNKLKTYFEVNEIEI